MVDASRRRVAARVLPLILGFWAACPPSPAFAETKRDFVSGPWGGYAIFDSETARFLTCSAGVPSGEKPWLLLSYWGNAVEFTVRNAPWRLQEGQGFAARLSVDDAWHTDADAMVLHGSSAAEPSIFSIMSKDVEAILRNAASGRRLIIERAGERRLSFSLSGAGRMLDSLKRCHRRGVALQQKADESDLKARDFFVPQEDAEAFAAWADELSKSAHLATTLMGMGDGVCRVVERLSRGEIDRKIARFAMGIILFPPGKAIEIARKEFAELDGFEPASGDRDLSVVLQAMTEGLLESAGDMLRDSRGVMTAVSRGEEKEAQKLYFALSRSSYLSYASDNVYLLIRNATRDNEQPEYHLNQASRSINLMNIALVNAFMLLSQDALDEKMPALIASSKGHIRDARRWARSGRAILTARLADAMRREESLASLDRIALLRAYVASLDEEDALADRFAAALAEIEPTIRSGAAVTEAHFWSLVHGGMRTAAGLLARRFALRMKRRSAAEALGRR